MVWWLLLTILLRNLDIFQLLCNLDKVLNKYNGLVVVSYRIADKLGTKAKLNIAFVAIDNFASEGLLNLRLHVVDFNRGTLLKRITHKFLTYRWVNSPHQSAIASPGSAVPFSTRLRYNYYKKGNLTLIISFNVNVLPVTNMLICKITSLYNAIC